MRILTNMRFWQSRAWTRAVESIYPAHRLPLGQRPLSPVREALELCRRSRDVDIVVTMGARISLLYGLLCAARRKPSKQIACELFIDDPRPNDPLWRFKNGLYAAILQRMIGLLTNSTREIEVAVQRFGISRERIRYVPLHTNISQPQISRMDDGYALSAGATRRDFGTLVRAATTTSFPIIIVCPQDQPLPASLPATVTVYRNIARDRYLDLVKRCSFSVVPLLPTDRATGQVVMLESMAFGKPVIATQTAGALDIIRDGVNGLLVPPHNETALAEAIHKLVNDTDFRQTLGRAALEDVLREHTIEIHATRKLAAIQDLFKLYGTSSKSATR